MWTCPKCGKQFRNANQWHSCARVDVETHLAKTSPEVRATYDKLLRAVERFGRVTLDPVKTAIQIRAGATFISLRVKRDHIDVDFSLARQVSEFPVYKSLRISRNRVLHFAVLEGPDDVDRRFVGWMREAYNLVRGDGKR